MVTLKSTHLDIMIDTLQLIVDYKSQALRKISWNKFHDEYLVSAVQQIHDNEFKVNNDKSNYFLWHLDQLCWSRVLVDGVHHNEGVPLIDTGLGQQAAEICRAAAKGQSFYDSYYCNSQFNNLFQ